MTPRTASLLCQCVDGGVSFAPVATLRLAGEHSWSAFGVRDPSILCTPKGDPVVDDAGRLTIFFNARDREVDDGGMTCVGMARADMASGWSVDPKPALVDGSYAAQGSVLRLAADHFRMYYSPDTLRGFALASSSDGLRWQRFGTGLILTPLPFGVWRMGLPFVRRVGNRWAMVFEGIADGRFHIYLATSSDGIDWQPGTQGRPVYAPEPGQWDSFGQANPSLYVANEGSEHPRYFILYNGCCELHGWDVGVLVSEALEGPWQHAPEPVLRRGRPSAWDAGRVEGARLVERPGCSPEVVYFALPTLNSYAGGCIAWASIGTRSDANTVIERGEQENAAAERAYNDQLALRYFHVWDSFPIQRFSTEAESRVIDEVVSPCSQVIVLGSGGARELPVLLKKSCRVTAVDISPQMLAVGKQRYPGSKVTWVEADLHRLPSHLVDFDAAVCLGAVFNYLRDPELFLANVRGCLKPEAVLILAVINAEHPSEREERIALPDGRVRQLYRVANLEVLLDAMGFEIVSIRGVRFLVDLLPAEWNSQAAQHPSGFEILNRILVDESRLSDCMPPERAKFILIHAIARGRTAGSVSRGPLSS